ncbi:hypothetical protein HCB26_03230 [Listeria booriae]|uniref:Uncharacterized protein n=1 Tax=Listeria booriae TaxID=1552123 RepID=A0A7X1D4D7_9LIST|nr:hypothetical protein [Listeria booriae]MBC2037747.1 hypothetical protein [Listeria booriae]MBC2165591.1 hypothetical protein [Listeria booriae]MBC2194468.1 hypothetical protein [Listeria booriae]
MKRNGMIFGIVFVAIFALAFLLRFVVPTPTEDFIISVDNYSGNKSSEITVSNAGTTIATIPALSNEESKEIRKKPVDLKPGGLMVSYVDKNGKKHESNMDLPDVDSTLNSTLYISFESIKKDGTMNMAITYSHGNVSVSSQE